LTSILKLSFVKRLVNVSIIFVGCFFTLIEYKEAIVGSYKNNISFILLATSISNLGLLKLILFMY